MNPERVPTIAMLGGLTAVLALASLVVSAHERIGWLIHNAAGASMFTLLAVTIIFIWKDRKI